MGKPRRWIARLRVQARHWRGSPLTWLIAGGFVLMTATAIGTALTVDRFRQNAIENGRENLENAVRVLAGHFDRQFGDFAVLQNSVIAEFASPVEAVMPRFILANDFVKEMVHPAFAEVLRWIVVIGGTVVAIVLFVT